MVDYKFFKWLLSWLCEIHNSIVKNKVFSHKFHDISRFKKKAAKSNIRQDEEVVHAQWLCCVQFFVTPWTVAARLLYPWDFTDKNTGVGCRFLLQGIFMTQGSNPCLLHCQADSLPLSHQKQYRSINYTNKHDTFNKMLNFFNMDNLIFFWIVFIQVNRITIQFRCCSVTKWCLTLVIPWTITHQAPLSCTISWSLLRFMSNELVMLSNHLIPCCPLLLSPSIFPSIRGFPMR